MITCKHTHKHTDTHICFNWDVFFGVWTKRYERVSLYITPILSMFSCGCNYTHDRSCTLIGCRQTEPLPLAVRRLLLIGLLFTLCSLALALACGPAVKIETVHTQHTDTDGTAPLVVMIHNSDNRVIRHTPNTSINTQTYFSWVINI